MRFRYPAGFAQNVYPRAAGVAACPAPRYSCRRVQFPSLRPGVCLLRMSGRTRERVLRPSFASVERMTIQRMDHVGIVVDDMVATAAFFVDLGLEPQGDGSVEG